MITLCIVGHLYYRMDVWVLRCRFLVAPLHLMNNAQY